MKKNQIYIGKIFGIPIGLDYSWFLIFILIAWILADSYFPMEFKGWTVFEYWITSIFTTILFFVSVILHELGHSVTALKYNIKVKRISLFIFGGISDIANEPPKPSAEFWIAIAGPVVSFALALIFYLLTFITGNAPQVYAVFEYLAYINFILALFNLIPGFPLDGGRILRAIVWAFTKNDERATNIAATVGRFFGFAFILIGAFEIFQGGLLNGMWIAFIGWFLESAAASQVQQMKMSHMLSAHKVSEAMSFDFGIVHKGTSLQEVLDNQFLGIGRRSLLVKNDDEDKFIGLLTFHNIKNVNREKWESTDVADVMIPFSDLILVDINTNLWDALVKMDKDGVNQLPVTHEGTITGILSRDSLITFMRNIHEQGS